MQETRLPYCAVARLRYPRDLATRTIEKFDLTMPRTGNPRLRTVRARIDELEPTDELKRN